MLHEDGGPVRETEFRRCVEALADALDNHDGADCIKACEVIEGAISNPAHDLTLLQISIALMGRVMSRMPYDQWRIVTTTCGIEAMAATEEALGVGETRH